MLPTLSTQPRSPVASPSPPPPPPLDMTARAVRRLGLEELDLEELNTRGRRVRNALRILLSRNRPRPWTTCRLSLPPRQPFTVPSTDWRSTSGRTGRRQGTRRWAAGFATSRRRTSPKDRNRRETDTRRLLPPRARINTSRTRILIGPTASPERACRRLTCSATGDSCSTTRTRAGDHSPSSTRACTKVGGMTGTASTTRGIWSGPIDST